ncbi:hypothetical protein MMC14_005181 [Varicellaria rhodocarpa]|nr:hypothetical protein [Varicellaria rhodocarpa]
MEQTTKEGVLDALEQMTDMKDELHTIRQVIGMDVLNTIIEMPDWDSLDAIDKWTGDDALEISNYGNSSMNDEMTTPEQKMIEPEQKAVAIEQTTGNDPLKICNTESPFPNDNANGTAMAEQIPENHLSKIPNTKLPAHFINSEVKKIVNDIPTLCITVTPAMERNMEELAALMERLKKGNNPSPNDEPATAERKEAAQDELLKAIRSSLMDTVLALLKRQAILVRAGLLMIKKRAGVLDSDGERELVEWLENC